MHIVIRVLTAATTPEEALDNAKNTLETLVGDGGPFDYFTTFDEEGTIASGKGRYGAIPAVLEADSTAGKAMIREAMRYTRKQFKDSMSRIRKASRYTDDELMNEAPNPKRKKVAKEDLSIIRHYFYRVGQYTGSEIMLYSGDGSGIRNQTDLANALDNYGSPLNDGERFYVVPADVHF
jgi:hypothetical protein